MGFATYDEPYVVKQNLESATLDSYVFFFDKKGKEKDTQDNVYKPFSNKTNYKEGESIKEVKGIEGRPPKVHIQSNKVHKCVP